MVEISQLYLVQYPPVLFIFQRELLSFFLSKELHCNPSVCYKTSLELTVSGIFGSKQIYFTSLSFVEVVLNYGLGCQNVMALVVLHCTCTNFFFVQLINFSDKQKDTGRQV